MQMLNFLPSSAEFLVNTIWNNGQREPDLAALTGGRTLAVWESYDDPSAASFGDIRAQIIGPNGVKIGPEFLVNTITNGHQVGPAAAQLTNGNIVVAWYSGTDTAGAIKARLYSSAGNPLGDEFLLSNNAYWDAGSPGVPSVAITALAGGRFAVAWEGEFYSSPPNGTAYGGLRMGIYVEQGAAVSNDGGISASENLYPGAGDLNRSIIGLADGNIVIGWQEAGASVAEIWSPNFALLAPRITLPGEGIPVLAPLANGGFVAVTSISDGSIGGLAAQLYSASGVPTGALIPVNEQTLANQTKAQVASTANGGFVVVWRTDDPAQDSSGSAIMARAFDSSGSALGGEVLVNQAATGTQDDPDVIVLDDGRVVITWNSFDPAQDGSGTAIKAREFSFDPPVITSNGGGTSAIINVNENSTFVTTVVATDIQTQPLTYSIIGGADAARFTINASTGVLAFVSAPNFEAPASAAGNNSYDVIVAVTDNSGFDQQALTVLVSDVAENRTYTGTNVINNFNVAVGSLDNWRVDGRGGNDIINTQNGSDVFIAGLGNDRYSSGAGNDQFLFSGDATANGFDVINGGDGSDSLVATANKTIISLESITGIETISSGGYSGVTIQGSENSNVFDFTGVSLLGITSINGAGGSDNITGSSADDVLLGGAGMDTINGGDGNDRIEGGAQADRLSGGVGADIFDYNSLAESNAANRDRIIDFQLGIDDIDLSTIDANSTVGGNQAFTFISFLPFTGTPGQLRFEADGATGIRILGDVNGDGIADLDISMFNLPGIQASDFIL
jgi:Ca2+-binding RTX toxin-like protein